MGLAIITAVAIGILVSCQVQCANIILQNGKPADTAVFRTRRAGDAFDSFVEEATHLAKIVNGIHLINQIIEGKAEDSLGELLNKKTSLSALEKFDGNQFNEFLINLNIGNIQSDVRHSLRSLSYAAENWASLQKTPIKSLDDAKLSKLAIFDLLGKLANFDVDNAINALDTSTRDVTKDLEIKTELENLVNVTTTFQLADKEEINGILKEAQRLNALLHAALQLKSWKPVDQTELSGFRAILNKMLKIDGGAVLAMINIMKLEDKKQTLGFTRGYQDLQNVKSLTSETTKKANLKGLAFLEQLHEKLAVVATKLTVAPDPSTLNIGRLHSLLLKAKSADIYLDKVTEDIQKCFTDNPDFDKIMPAIQNLTTATDRLKRILYSAQHLQLPPVSTFDKLLQNVQDDPDITTIHDGLTQARDQIGDLKNGKQEYDKLIAVKSLLLNQDPDYIKLETLLKCIEGISNVEAVHSASAVLRILPLSQNTNNRLKAIAVQVTGASADLKAVRAVHDKIQKDRSEEIKEIMKWKALETDLKTVGEAARYAVGVQKVLEKKLVFDMVRTDTQVNSASTDLVEKINEFLASCERSKSAVVAKKTADLGTRFAQLKGVTDPEMKLENEIYMFPNLKNELTQLSELDLSFASGEKSLDAMSNTLQHVSGEITGKSNKNDPEPTTKEAESGGAMLYVFVGIGVALLILLVVGAVLFFLKKKSAGSEKSKNSRGTPKKTAGIGGLFKKNTKSKSMEKSGSGSSDVAKTPTSSDAPVASPATPEAPSMAMATARTETPTELKSKIKPKNEGAPKPPAGEQKGFLASDLDPTMEQV